MGCIYKITNTKNNKCYIGLTINTAEKRFKKHLSMVYSNGCSALYSAFKKYSIDNFIISTIEESDDRDKLMVLESFYIDKFKTLSPMGYNLTTGGENCNISNSTKEKIRNAMKGREVTWGNKVSKSVKKNYGKTTNIE